MFDLHHLGAEAAEHLGGIGERLHLLRREHPYAVEGLAEAGSAGVRDVTESHGAPS
jgi:hypothetical protein